LDISGIVLTLEEVFKNIFRTIRIKKKTTHLHSAIFPAKYLSSVLLGNFSITLHTLYNSGLKVSMVETLLNSEFMVNTPSFS
jgi:hypothetical protein